MRIYVRNGVLYVDIKGRRKSTKLKDTKANRKKIESYYKDEEFKQQFNLKVKSVPTVAELVKKAIDMRDVKETTRTGYVSNYNSRIKTYFADMKITELTPLKVRDFYNTFDSFSSFTLSKTLLSLGIEEAILQGCIEHSPLIGLKNPRFKDEYSPDPFSIDDINLLLNSAEGYFRNMIAISFYTGMRPGELISLKWEDIDFKKMEISINRNVTKGFIQTPKTKKSIRIIEIIDELLPYLKDQQFKTGLREYLFYSSLTKEPYQDAGGLRAFWITTLKNANLSYRRYYFLRHSFASIMLSEGEDLMWVSAMLGHKSPDITLRKYGRYVKRKKKKRAQFLKDYTQNTHIL